MAEKDQDLFSKLCLKCIRPCKQPVSMLLLDCPRFQPRPFKSEACKFQQLDLFQQPKR